MGRDDIEERILDAAARLLIRFGYDKTTLDDVAREAGLSRSTLYTRWKKKDVLFQALIWREGERYADDFIMQLENDPEAGTLAGFFRLAMTVLNNNPFMLTVYARERQILGAILLQDNVTQLYQWRINSTASFLTILQNVGMIRADVDVQTLSYLLSCLQLGILKMSEVIPNEQSPPMDQLMDQSVLMLNAYAPSQEIDRAVGHAALLDYLRTLRAQLSAIRSGSLPTTDKDS